MSNTENVQSGPVVRSMFGHKWGAGRRDGYALCDACGARGNTEESATMCPALAVRLTDGALQDWLWLERDLTDPESMLVSRDWATALVRELLELRGRNADGDARPTAARVGDAVLWVGAGIPLADLPDGHRCMAARELGGWLVGTDAQLDEARRLMGAAA